MGLGQNEMVTGHSFLLTKMDKNIYCSAGNKICYLAGNVLPADDKTEIITELSQYPPSGTFYARRT